MRAANTEKKIFNILIVTQNYVFGGLETHIYGKIRHLNEHGHNVILVTGSTISEENLPHDLCKKIITGLNFSSEASAQDFVHTTQGLVDLIEEHDIHFVDAHPFFSALPAFFAAGLTNRLYSYTAHGPASVQDFSLVSEILVKEVLLKQASLVCNVSEEIRQLTKDYVPEDSNYIVPNGVNVTTFLPVQDQGRTAFDTCCVVSRLDNSKVDGIKTFLEVAASTQLKQIDVIGDGAGFDDLRQWIEQNIDENHLRVRLLGARFDLKECYKDYAVIAGMGRVVLEGAALNKPVVLVGYDGVKGLLDKGMIQKAAITNFSGRGFSNIEAEDLNKQLAELQLDTPRYQLSSWVQAHANEDVIWNDFIRRIHALKPVQSQVVLDAYRCFLKNHSAVPYESDYGLLIGLKSVLNINDYNNKAVTKVHRQTNTMDNDTFLNDSINQQLVQELSAKLAEVVNLSRAVEDLRKVLRGKEEEALKLQEYLTARDRLLDEKNVLIQQIQDELHTRQKEDFQRASILEEQVAELKGQLLEYRQKAIRVQEEQADSNNHLRRGLKEKEEEAQRLQEYLTAKDRLLEEKNALIQQVQEELHTRQKEDLERASLLEEIKDKVNNAEASETEIVQLRNELLDKESQFTQLNIEVAGYRSRDKHLQESLDHVQTELSVCKRNEENLRREVEQLRHENHSLKSGVGSLSNEKATLVHNYHVLSCAYYDLLNSKSWKYTRPLRLPFYFARLAANSLRQKGIKATLKEMNPVKGFTSNGVVVIAPVNNTATPDMMLQTPVQDHYAETIIHEALEDMDRRHKIAIYVQEFNEGGVERVALDLAIQLRNRGNRVAIFVANEGGRIQKEALAMGISVYVLHQRPEALQSAVREFTPDLVLLNHCYFELQAFNAPIIEIVHNAYFWQKNNNHYEKLRDRNIQHFVAVSSFVRDFTINHLGIKEDKVTVINNGLNIEGFIRTTAPLRKVHRQKTLDNFTFILVASVRPSKCHNNAITAFKEVLNKYPNARLEFAGGVDDKELHKKLQERIVEEGLQSNIAFLGSLNRRELSRKMTEVHAALLPSSYEGFSIASLEYMFFGLPVILSDVGAAHDIIHKNDIGLIVSAPVETCRLNNDAIHEVGYSKEASHATQELSGAMLDIIDNYQEWSIKGEKAIEKVRSYSIEEVTNKYVDLINYTILK